MSLVPGTLVHQGNVVGGVMPDISSALGYKEHIDSACINPNGYTAGSYFVGADDGYFYCVTANIAAGDTITIGTNCVQTDVGAEIKSIKSDLTEKTQITEVIINATAGTWGSQFAQVVNALDHAKVNEFTKVSDGNNYYSLARYDSANYYYFSLLAQSNGGWYQQAIVHNSSGGDKVYQNASDITNNSVAARTWKIFYLN